MESCFSAEITKTISLPELSAGSGIEFIHDKFYIAGDDVNVLYILDKQYKLIDTIPLVPGADGSRMIKRDKLDLEMLTCFTCNGVLYLLTAGSGSLRNQRENGFLFEGDFGCPLKVDLSVLYDLFREKLGLKKVGDLNLEGLASDSEKFYWFQRGNIHVPNAILSITIPSFLDYIRNKYLPETYIQYFKLPDIDGVVSGFSGGVYLENFKSLCFCASAEDTDNSYDDGKVAGSFLGFIDQDEFTNGRFRQILVYYNNEPFRHKLESVTLRKFHENRLDLTGVCDNDDGTTLLVEISVYLQ